HKRRRPRPDLRRVRRRRRHRHHRDDAHQGGLPAHRPERGAGGCGHRQPGEASEDQLGLDAPVAPGQEHRRGTGAVAGSGLQRMSVQQSPTVVFDLGGVLVDCDPRYLYRKLLPDDAAVEKFLAEVTAPQWNREQDAGRSWDEAVAVLSEQFPEHSELIAAYHHRWTEMISGQIDGTVTTLRALHEAGVPLDRLTNWAGGSV